MTQQTTPKPLEFLSLDSLERSSILDYLEEQGLPIRDPNPITKIINPEHEGTIIGSNPYTIVALDMFYRMIDPTGNTTIASQRDLELSLRNGDPLKIKGKHYVDSGLWLTDKEKGHNEYLAERLRDDLQGETQFPIYLPPRALRLEHDSEAPSNLAFRISTQTNQKPIQLPHLTESGDFNPEDVDYETGFPKKLGSGNRHFYSGKHLLSSLYRGRNLGVDSGYGRLGGSSDYGRVVLRVPEARV